MGVILILGFVLMLQGQWLSAGWLHAKLLLVAVMIVMHAFMGRWAADFRMNRNAHSQKFYRIINEVPTLLMIVIVILVVVKPF